MFSLLLASALLCLALFAFAARILVIPWFIVSIVDAIAWRLGWQTYVQAQGGPGWHLGRIGAESVYFIRRDPQAVRLPRLRRLPPLMAFAVAMIALAGCTTKLQNAYNFVTTSAVPSKTIMMAVQTFNASEILAASYIRYCTPKVQPAGCSDTAIQKIIANMPTWRKARDDAFQFARDNPNGSGPAALYQGVQTAASDISDIINQFNVKAVVPATK